MDLGEALYLKHGTKIFWVRHNSPGNFVVVETEFLSIRGDGLNVGGYTVQPVDIFATKEIADQVCAVRNEFVHNFNECISFVYAPYVLSDKNE
jgi:hypothetical protein